MDKDTSDKLNETLGKMGVMGSAQAAGPASSNAVKSSDKSFYLTILAMVVAMALYVSYDMGQRYGSGSADAVVAPAQNAAQEAVIVSIEKKKSVAVKPNAEIPATEETPEAVIVATEVNNTTATTAVVPVEEQPDATTIPATTKPAAAWTKTKPVSDRVPVVTGVVNEMEKQYKEVVEAAGDTASKVIAAPLVEHAEKKIVDQPAAVAEPAPVGQSAPVSNAYGYPYGRSYQRNYYPPQRPYRNPYYNQNRNPYGYGPGYGPGYGYNPYQPPAAAAAK